MKPLRRILVALGAVAVVGAAGLGARVATMAGVFDEVKPLPRKCTALAGVTGAEDMQVDARDNLLFVSATDRRAIANGRPSASDGIYTLPLEHPEAGFTKLAGTPAVFHPHGISLFRAADGSLTVMAVNHLTPERHAIDIFEFAQGKLDEVGDIESDKLNHPNDVAAVGKEKFYVTNDHGSRTKFGQTLEDYLMLPRADVLYFDGAVFREAATGLVFANGINVSNDGGHVYVAESTARRVRTFSRERVSGMLSEEAAFDFPSGPDNIDVDAAGDLWVAGHPKMFALVGYSTDASKPSPSEIFKLATKDGVPQSAAPVYVDAGREIGAGSVGAVSGKTLFVGSIFDAKILQCKLP